MLPPQQENTQGLVRDVQMITATAKPQTKGKCYSVGESKTVGIILLVYWLITFSATATAVNAPLNR